MEVQLKKLGQFRGKGTTLVSLLMSSGTDL